jgi:hypothetical protein
VVQALAWTTTVSRSKRLKISGKEAANMKVKTRVKSGVGARIDDNG